MLRDTVRDMISSRLGNRPDLADAIVLEMEMAMQTTLGQDPTLDAWFTRSEYATFQTTALDSRVPVPADFVSEVEDASLQVYNAKTDRWIALTKEDLDVLETRYIGAEPGFPKFYAQIGTYFRLFPTPDQEYQLRQIYRQLPQSVLNENIENVWLKYAPDLVVAVVAATMAREYLQNFDLATKIETTSLPIARDRLWKLIESQKIVNKEIVMKDIR